MRKQTMCSETNRAIQAQMMIEARNVGLRKYTGIVLSFYRIVTKIKAPDSFTVISIILFSPMNIVGYGTAQIFTDKERRFYTG